MEYTYEWYTIPEPYELPPRINGWLDDINSGNQERRRQAETQINPILQQLGLTVLQHVFNINPVIVTGNRKTGEIIYGTFICITRHLCLSLTTIGKYITKEDSVANGDVNSFGIIPDKMYFSDLKIIEDENDNIIIQHLNTYKMSTGNLSGFIFRWHPSETLGIRLTNKSYSSPLFGISKKKFFIPEHSYFVEGSHQELYEYPFHFFASESAQVDGIDNENYKTNAIWNATCRKYPGTSPEYSLLYN